MTPGRKAELEKRWQECERQIRDIHVGKVVDGDPAEAEGKLLEVQDSIEYEMGMEYFWKRSSRSAYLARPAVPSNLK